MAGLQKVTGPSSDADADALFRQEVERLRRAGVPGPAGRVADLFDYLSSRGAEAAPASQADIAREVFGQELLDGEDASVRVYVHRLRKRIEDFYAASGAGAGGQRIELPPGSYVLRLRMAQGLATPQGMGDGVAPAPAASAKAARRRRDWIVAALVLAALAGLALLGAALLRSGGNAVWQPLLRSERPTLIVVGDYYIYGEIDPLRPDAGRLIRDFRVNSAEDLLRLQEADPARYAAGEDQGLSYLPLASAAALARVAPLLEAGGKRVEVVAASAFEPRFFTTHDIVYIGLISGLGLLEAPTFAGAGVVRGESYDELTDQVSGRRFVSEEARRLASPATYRDHAYLARFTAPGGALVIVLAGARDTGLKALAPIAAEPLPDALAEAARRHPAFEALVTVTGQQGEDLAGELVFARRRD